MKKISKILLAIMLIVGVLSTSTSCQEDAPEINYTTTITVTNDFSKVVEAINNGTLKQAEAIAKLTQAIDNMAASQEKKLQALMDIINSQANSIATKLAAIESAMKAQTISLEKKFDLLNEAVKNNTIKIEELSNNLAKAIDNMSGNMAEKLDAIKKIIEKTEATNAEKLAAIEGAMKAQTIAFKEKMDILKDVMEQNTDMVEKKGDLIADAIDAMNDTMDEKLKNIYNIIDSTGATTAEQIETMIGVMKAQTIAFNKKMNMLNRTIKNLPDYTDQINAIKDAIEALPDYNEKIQAIAKAIEALPNYSDKIKAIADAIGALPNYTTKIEAIANAIEALPNYNDKFDAVAKSLDSIKAQMSSDIKMQDSIKTVIAKMIAKVVTSINNLKTEIATGNTDEKTALADIIAKLEELKGSIGGGSGSGSGSGSGGGSGSGSGSGSSGSFIPPTLTTPTKSNYYKWDAVDPVNGTNTNYNKTTTSNAATNSCKDASTANEMCIYLGNGVYWDNGYAGTDQQSYIIDGTTHHTGLWVKKWEHCNKILSATEVKSAPLFNTGRPDASEIDKYFFLPACGYYPSGLSLRKAGTDGHYWSSTPTIGDANYAYKLDFSSDNASVSDNRFDRTCGFVPMPKL